MGPGGSRTFGNSKEQIGKGVKGQYNLLPLPGLRTAAVPQFPQLHRSRGERKGGKRRGTTKHLRKKDSECKLQKLLKQERRELDNIISGGIALNFDQKGQQASAT